jgi:hypothetical protein
VGCSDWGEEPGLNILELESANVSFDAFGGARDIIVKSMDSLTATCNASWCTTSVSGNKVSVTVPANEELLSRATVVTVISGVKKVQVPVMQSGVFIDFDRSPLTISGEAGDTTLVVNAPVPVKVSSSATWLVSSVSGATLKLQAEVNPTFDTRASTLTLTAGSFSISVEVTQQGKKAFLPFNAYTGAWTFTHTTGASASGSKYNKTAVVTAAGTDTLSVNLKAGTEASSTFTFIMTYDPATGTVHIPAQKVFESNGSDVSLFVFNGSAGIRFSGGMTGKPVGGTPDKPVLAFKHSIDPTEYMGFILVLAPDSEYTEFGNSSTSRYTNITMTK